MARQPGTILVDNGPDYISGKLLEWAEWRRITTLHIQFGQPQSRLHRPLQSDGLARAARPIHHRNDRRGTGLRKEWL